VKFNSIVKDIKGKRKKNGSWNVDLEFILIFYDAFLREPALKRVAKDVFETTEGTLAKLIEKHPELAQAKALAEHNRQRGALGSYVLKNLSKEARETWEKLTSLTTFEEIEALFRNRPQRLRQQLFCHAIIHTGHDISKACAMVGVDRRKMENWKTDLAFLQMLEEVQFHKKNYWEHALHNLGMEGYPAAIIFANRTLNRDRGYGDDIVIDMGPAGRHDFEWEELAGLLDVETQKKILDAIELRKKAVEEEAEAAGFGQKKLKMANGTHK